MACENRAKKLKRMPHIFSQVLELPLPSDFAVECRESDAAFEFVALGCGGVVEAANDAENEQQIQAQVHEIVPGARKVTVQGLSRRRNRRNGEQEEEEEEESQDEIVAGNWRLRLPPQAKLEEASVELIDDDVLKVVLPKTKTADADHRDSNDENADHRGDASSQCVYSSPSASGVAVEDSTRASLTVITVC